MKNNGILATLAIATIALSACKGQQPAPQASASVSAPATVAAASASASAAPAQSACGPVPKFDVDAGTFGANAAKFAPGTPARTQFEANFASAFKAACDAGYFAKKPLIDPTARPKDTLTVFNAPEANTVSIYLSEGPSMVLEYPFVDTENKASAPDVATLKEAFYCTTVGATDKEQEESGRCLVD